MILRRMTEEDIEQVEAIEKSLFTDAWSTKSFLETLASGAAVTMVAEEKLVNPLGECGNVILGYLVMYISFDEGEISKVAVAKPAQNNGIGSMMMQGILERGNEQGITKYVLEVRESNESGLALYEKYKFKQIGIRRGFYDNPREDAIIMIREEETEQC